MRYLIFTTALLFTLTVKSQTCGSLVAHSGIPNPLYDTTQAYLNLQVYCNEFISLQSQNIVIAGSSITVDAYYCYGWLQVITTTNDSIPLGILAPGTYIYNVTIYNSYAPSTNCTSYTISDQQTGTITVYPVTNDIKDQTPAEVIIFPNPSDGMIQIENYEEVSAVSLYSLDGKMIYSTDEINQTNALPEEIQAGVYLMIIKLKTGRFLQEKLMLEN